MKKARSNQITPVCDKKKKKKKKKKTSMEKHYDQFPSQQILEDNLG